MLVLGAAMGCPEPDPGGSGSSGPELPKATDSSSGGADPSGEADLGSMRSLVVPQAWQPTVAAEDPFAQERPSQVECALGWAVETGAFEVDTELCRYGAFSQPSRTRIHAGDTIELVMIHDALYAPQPATAHLAIALDDAIVWETELPIPSEPGLLRPSWTATADVARGTPVHYHVHNHGTNNYRLIDLTVTRLR